MGEADTPIFQSATISCPVCKGIGVKPGTAYPEGVGDEYEPCDTCAGEGNIRVSADTPSLQSVPVTDKGVDG